MHNAVAPLSTRTRYVVEALDGRETPTEAVLTDAYLMAVAGLWVAACAWAYGRLRVEGP